MVGGSQYPQPTAVLFLPSMLLASLDRDFQQSAGEGRDRFLEGGRTLRSVAMGTTEQHHWLEDKQAVSLTSD